MVVALIVTWALGGNAARADVAGTTPLANRPAHIAALAAAVRDLGGDAREALVRELRTGARTTCRADIATPDVGCVLPMARAVCAAKPAAERSRCQLVADVVVTNYLAEHEWVERKKRIQIMNESDDYVRGMRAELRKRYAMLAAELMMFRGFGPGEQRYRAIDAFCVRRARRRRLAWSRCVAALVWYINTSPLRRQP